MTNERLKSAMDNLTMASCGNCGVYVDQGMIRIKHNSLTRVIPQVKEIIQTVELRLALTAFSAPMDSEMCQVNFDYVAGVVDATLDDQLSSVLNELTQDTNGESGIYLGHGLILGMFKSMMRVLPRIKATVQLADQFVALTAMSAPDFRGQCLLNFDKMR